MKVFERSAAYYDDLYKSKNYAAEADYVDKLLQRFAPGAQSIIDLGCGTGRHAAEFAKKGHSVLGVDRSAGMLEKAECRRKELAPEIRERLSFQEADIRGLTLGRPFDAAVALFHVASYQTSNADFFALLKTARAHIRPGGVLVFDCWYGPGVLGDPPVIRVARFDDGPRRLVRIAEPTLRTAENVVDVNYSFILVDCETGGCSEFSETHSMRYFFVPELDLAMQMVGFERLLIAQWMTGSEPDGKTWSISVVARASHQRAADECGSR